MNTTKRTIYLWHIQIHALANHKSVFLCLWFPQQNNSLLVCGLLKCLQQTKRKGGEVQECELHIKVDIPADMNMQGWERCKRCKENTGMTDVCLNWIRPLHSLLAINYLPYYRPASAQIITIITEHYKETHFLKILGNKKNYFRNGKRSEVAVSALAFVVATVSSYFCHYPLIHPLPKHTVVHH